MLSTYSSHNLFWQNLKIFCQSDPHLLALSQLKYQHSSAWWERLNLDIPGIYILTGGRQVGKSTSCKQLIKKALEKKTFPQQHIFYLPCDEIYDAEQLSHTVRNFFQTTYASPTNKYLLIIDEITYVKNWDRVIKALADEGHFKHGVCILTGSDTLILKEAAMRFPGRRGDASETDFHLYPLSFREYVDLCYKENNINNEKLYIYFKNYLECGGYLRAINDKAEHGNVIRATFLTYEQWLRGDFLKQNKKEDYLLSLLSTLITVGVSQISYSKLTQKIGMISKETCMDYMRLLERMDVLINLQAFDQNKMQGFPRKDRKFHFLDPFIQRTIYQWLKREGYINTIDLENVLVEACVASHCHRSLGKTFYLKGQGEIDVVWLKEREFQTLEIKWAEKIRPADLKMLKQFKKSIILGRQPIEGKIDNIRSMPVYQFLYHILLLKH